MFWALSWREYDAHKELWAQERADFCNANYSTDGIPFIAEDFLGTGNREARKAEATISKTNAEMANVQLQNKVNPGSTEGIPDWALGDYSA